MKLYLLAPSSLARREEGPPDVSPEEFGEKIVLVVENEAKLRKLAVQMLERLGLRTMQAETAKDALELLADTHVDVLFTDIELPGGMNGMELADAARKLDPDYQVPFKFNGKIDKLTFNLGPTQLAPEEKKKAGEAAAKARD